MYPLAQSPTVRSRSVTWSASPEVTDTRRTGPSGQFMAGGHATCLLIVTGQCGGTERRGKRQGEEGARCQLGVKMAPEPQLDVANVSAGAPHVPLDPLPLPCCASVKPRLSLPFASRKGQCFLQ